MYVWRLKNYCVQIYFILSLGCNLHCSHCIRGFGTNPKKSIDLRRANSILESIAAVDSKAQIILTGGEPTLHKDFFLIAKTANKNFSNVTICTNGIYSDEVLKRLCNLKNSIIQISLDGNQEAHDKIRGKGNFLRALNSVRALLAHDIPVKVSTTVNKENIGSLFNLSEMLSNLKIIRWKVSLEQAFSETESKRQVDTQEWNNFVDDLLKKVKIPISIKKIYDFQLFEKMERKFGKNFLKMNSIQNCGCCTSKIYIYPDLSVRACTCMDYFTLGSFKENTYLEILDYMKTKKTLLDISEESPCAKCEWLYLCNGGCPGYSNYYFGKIGYGDIRCPRVKEYYGL